MLFLTNYVLWKFKYTGFTTSKSQHQNRLVSEWHIVYEFDYFDLIPDIYGLDWIGLGPENGPLSNSGLSVITIDKI